MQIGATTIVERFMTTGTDAAAAIQAPWDWFGGEGDSQPSGPEPSISATFRALDEAPQTRWLGDLPLSTLASASVEADVGAAETAAMFGELEDLPVTKWVGHVELAMLTAAAIRTGASAEEAAAAYQTIDAAQATRYLGHLPTAVLAGAAIESGTPAEDVAALYGDLDDSAGTRWVADDELALMTAAQVRADAGVDATSAGRDEAVVAIVQARAEEDE